MTKFAALVVLSTVLLSSVTSADAAGGPARAVRVDGAPSPQEAATIDAAFGRSFGKEWADFVRANGRAPTVAVGHADIDDDGKPDLVVLLTDGTFGYCGTAGCSGYALLAAGRFSAAPIDLADFFESVTLLPRRHRGMHDLRFDDGRKVFVWDGYHYR